MPVIDASVLVELFSGGPRADQANQAIADHRQELIAPHLVDAEVGSGLRGLTAAGQLDPDRAERALWALSELPLTRAPHTLLLGEAWSMRDRVTFYDALYLALAKVAGVRLVTIDRPLARAARTFNIETELLAKG